MEELAASLDRVNLNDLISSPSAGTDDQKPEDPDQELAGACGGSVDSGVSAFLLTEVPATEVFVSYRLTLIAHSFIHTFILNEFLLSSLPYLHGVGCCPAGSSDADARNLLRQCSSFNDRMPFLLSTNDLELGIETSTLELVG